MKVWQTLSVDKPCLTLLNVIECSTVWVKCLVPAVKCLSTIFSSKWNVFGKIISHFSERSGMFGWNVWCQPWNVCQPFSAQSSEIPRDMDDSSPQQVSLVKMKFFNILKVLIFSNDGYKCNQNQMNDLFGNDLVCSSWKLAWFRTWEYELVERISSHATKRV